MGIASGLFLFSAAFMGSIYYFQKHSFDASKTQVSELNHSKCTSWSGTLGGDFFTAKDCGKLQYIQKCLALLKPTQAYCFPVRLINSASAKKNTKLHLEFSVSSAWLLMQHF